MRTMATGTRDRIVDAAAELLRERGYAGTGLKAISEKAPAPFGSLYHFFPGGKEELAAAALRHAAGGYARQVDAVLNEAGDDLVAAVRLGFDRAAQLLVETDYADACPIATVALEVASTNELLREVTANIFEGWLRGLEARFAAGGLDAAAARAFATLFLAALEGGFLLSRSAQDPAPMRIIGQAVGDAVEAALAPAG
jgi:AcrR family transcriptional regulator